MTCSAVDETIFGSSSWEMVRKWTGLVRRVKQYGLEAAVGFRGHVSDVAPELAACDILILPSKAEGVPLILLEALACSRPVVASAVGGIPEVVTAATGILVAPGRGEIRRFADAIQLLMENPELGRKLGENGRALVCQNYDRRRSTEEYRKLLAG